MARTMTPTGVQRLVGAFVLTGAALAVGTAVFAARAHDWFKSRIEITLILPPEGSFGLRAGADVEVLGTRAGRVVRIQIDRDTGVMQADLLVDEDFAAFLAESSPAIIRKRFGIGGDAFLEIVRPTDPNAPPITEDGAVLTAVADRGPTELLQQVVEQIRTEAVPALKDARTAINDFSALAQRLRDPDAPLERLLVNLVDLSDRLRNEEAPLQRVLSNLERITASINRSEGALGRFVNDPAWADRVGESLDRLATLLESTEKTVTSADTTVAEIGKLATSLNESSKELPAMIRNTSEMLVETRGAIGDLRASSRKLPELIDSLTAGAETLPGLVFQAQETVREAGELVKAMQRHWLLRSYVERQAPPERIGGGE